ncbi:MAG: hypothetical protein WC843_04010 [Candidatus Gracilibacteria bacterium]|jgi:hypothetical protein
MKNKKTIIIGIAIAAITIIAIITIAAINFGKFGKILPQENKQITNDTQAKTTTTQTQTQTETQTKATDNTLEFKSRFGYIMNYPKDWIIDDSQKKAPAEFINEPSGKAFVSIQMSNDPRLTKTGGRALVLTDIKKSFESNSKYKLELFELDNKTNDLSESYFAAGSYADGTKNWRFKEIGILNDSGTISTFREMVLKEYAGTYGTTLDNILFSFHNKD